MIIFLIRIMDADWEVLKVQIKGFCLESCTSSYNVKLPMLTLQLYGFGKPCKLWQNKLAKPHCWTQHIVLQLVYKTTKTMPEYSDNLEDKVILSAAVQYAGSSWKKWYSNYQGECLQENLNYNFLHHSAQAICTWKDLSQLQLFSAFRSP